MDDLTLIEAFIAGFIQGEVVLLSNPNLRSEPIFNTVQLLAKKEGIIAIATSQEPRSALVKRDSFYQAEIHQIMSAKSFLPIGTTEKDGFDNYQHCPVPNGYQLHYTNALQLWGVWWGRKSRRRLGIPMDLLILNQGSWSPFRDLICSDGILYLKTLGRELILHGADMVVWLKKLEEETPVSKPLGQNALGSISR